MAKRKRIENNVHVLNNAQKAPAKSQNQNAVKGVKSQVSFSPRNLTQARLLKAIQNEKNHIIFALGPAGSGKSYLVAKHAIQSLMEGKVDKIVITRPTVANGENIGYLPGNLEEKMEPWVLPIYDVFMEHQGITKNEIRNLTAKGTIEIAPFSFMRGRSLKNSIIIADEMQNATIDQMKMLLTRIGEGSKILITGDLEQTDLDRKRIESGLQHFLKAFNLYENDKEGIEVINFSKNEIVRHPIISKILDIYS